MSQPSSPDLPAGAAEDLPCTQADGVPTFLGADYVATELPTYITRARTKEAQALLDRAYEECKRDV